MLWACLRFPQLALDIVDDDADAQSRQTPFAVIDGPLQRRHIVRVNACAQKMGVRSGHPLTAARALCPHLTVAPRDPAAERKALEAIAAFAYRFSAEVSIGEPDTVFLEIGASLALFGGIAALQRRLSSEIAAFGFASTLAIAPTAAGARVLAAHVDGLVIPSPLPFGHALGLVPISLCDLDEKITAALHGMGFRLLRDLFRLPRAELARRVGQDTIDWIDRARGIAAESLLRYRPPDFFEHRLEFPFGIESHGALAFPLQRLIRSFATFLVARDGGVQRFSLILGHERGASTRIEIGLLAPRCDAASLFELARARLERIALPAAAHALTLRADDLPPLCPLHRDLFDTSRAEKLDWSTLAERLRARLGDETLHGLRCVPDHRPGQAWQFGPVVSETSKKSPVRVAGSARTSRHVVSGDGRCDLSIRSEIHASTRPFWLLRRLIPLHAGPARVLAGPERIESGWWDDRDRRRDYYVVETRLGQRGWAFVPAGSTTDWMLHGWFA
ncbi:MAG TPA: DNA polymerase Y family protein [Rhodanobacteraceae bacterium]|jgi:protein ImuB|nr:DNA polymerase Y family protein [Rhodanobacteraceae bacterium]